MQLILFTPPNVFSGESNLLNYFLKDENLIVHVRKPLFSEHELCIFLKSINANYHSRLVIHQHIILLKKFNLKGYHCTRYFRSKKEFNISELKKDFPSNSFSKSCHSIKEISCSGEYQYVFLSPIFDSISKENYHSNFNLEEVKNTLIKTKYNVYALGGVSSKMINKTKELNFNGVGVLGSVWNSLTPKEEYNKLKDAIL